MTSLTSRGALLWSCFLTVAAIDKVLPPENVRLGWKDCYHQLSWTPPQHPMKGCEYLLNSTIKQQGGKVMASYRLQTLHWSEHRVMNGGFLNISIQTECGTRRSEAVLIIHDDPDIPVSCVIMSSKQTRCSWKTPASAQLHFFYSIDEDEEVWECPRYSGSGSACDLSMGPHQQITLLLNGTLGDRPIRNVHLFSSLRLKLPALEWSVEESKEQFFINWTKPEFDDLNWKYIIRFTACNNTSEFEVNERAFNLSRVAECQYKISMRGVVTYSGGTEWTEEKHFDAASGLTLVMLGVVLAPLLLAALVLLTLYWCMKNKEKIFPKVPQPNSALFKDLINNNNKINAPNFYFPKVEEECQVTLVVFPNQPQL